MCHYNHSLSLAFKRVRPFIPREVAVQINNALILPHFDYCIPVWDCMSGYLSDKFHNVSHHPKIPFLTFWKFQFFPQNMPINLPPTPVVYYLTTINSHYHNPHSLKKIRD